MVKKMRFEWNPCSSVNKNNHVIAKFAVTFFLMGLAFRLLYSHSIGYLPISVEQVEKPSVESLVLPAQTLVSSEILQAGDQNAQKEKCDIFTGDWIPNPSGPIYTNETCHVIQEPQNCMRNGRPDSGYLYWRWKPRDCELSQFDAERFLVVMRNKSWAFIGDSISRNHVQSLLCILSKVEEAVEVYHDKEYRSKIWHFPSHNFTLSVVWSPFLAHAETFEDSDGVSSAEIQLYLDEVDKKWTDQYQNYDYMVIAGGKWFLKTAIYYENKTIKGCHYCPGKNLTEVGVDYAYQSSSNGFQLHHFIGS
ncbi:hypothetical protein IFM89_037619 [Coptis chinensis]|uniref:Trichome birefringence-like N-terminal domain-containing protein n=1 Tax=Coptis chinensis TaxID=261450 RepID=A0A835J3W4_9MAGN|nr:hypothetical protein IFM89_037619 [Coptis chinensis]